MFYPGGGRPKGSINRASRELKEELQLFFSSPEYRQSVKARIIAGSAPTIEIYFLQLLYGRPREVFDVHVQVETDLSALSVQELTQRAEDLVTQLRDAQDLQKQIAPYIDANVEDTE